MNLVRKMKRQAKREEEHEARKAVSELEADADRGDDAEALYQMAQFEWRTGSRGGAVSRLKRASKMGHHDAQKVLMGIAQRRTLSKIKKQIRPSGAR